MLDGDVERAVQLKGVERLLSPTSIGTGDALAARDGDAAARAVAEQITGVEQLTITTALNSPQVAVMNLATAT